MVPHPDVLACPQTHGPLQSLDDALLGPAGARYLITDGLIDFCPDITSRPGLAQRAMESPGVARIYEGRFRPALTRLVGGPSYAAESDYLWRHLGPPGGVVLDLACGTGRYTRMLAERLGADRVIGLDLSGAMLAHARAESPGLSFVRGSAQALPIRTGSLAAVVSFGALHLFPDPAAALTEVGRVLEPGGRFVCLTAHAPDAGAVRVLQDRVGGAIRLRFLPRSVIEAGLSGGGVSLVDLTATGMMALLCGEKVPEATS
ncbi:MAG: SAM-dependent methyltransferase [Myxococcota bacterium]|jgi:SAM-dependent methyltransferase